MDDYLVMKPALEQAMHGMKVEHRFSILPMQTLEQVVVCKHRAIKLLQTINSFRWMLADAHVQQWGEVIFIDNSIN
jgi:hypothetical protein